MLTSLFFFPFLFSRAAESKSLACGGRWSNPKFTAKCHPSLTTAAKKRRAIQQLHDVIAVQEGTLHFTALTSYEYRGADGALHHWFVLDDHEDDRHLSATEQGTTAAFPEVTGDGP